MLNMIKKWRNKAYAINTVVSVMRDSRNKEKAIESCVVESNEDILTEAEQNAVESAITKVATVYLECANELETKLWEV